VDHLQLMTGRGRFENRNQEITAISPGPEAAGQGVGGAAVGPLATQPRTGESTGRYIIARGWVALAIEMYVSTVQLDTLIRFKSAAILRLIQSVELGLLFAPVTMAGYIGCPAEKANSVAGLINFMRNIGSSVGASMVTTLLARRAQVHEIVLSQHTTRFDRSGRRERCRRAPTGLRSGLPGCWKNRQRPSRTSIYCSCSPLRPA
jgi:hypothetical protein